MTKKERDELARLDRQLDHWKATDKEHKAEVARMAELTKHDFDWFDHIAYQRTIYGNRWNR